MNRNRFFALLAGAAVASVAAVPAFAQGNAPADKTNNGKSANAGAKANRGLAALAARAKSRAAQGTLTKVEGTAPTLTLTLETKRDATLVVTTNADTKLRGKGHEDGTLADLKNQLGARIVAVGERDGNKLVAKHLIVRAAKDEKDE